MMFSRVDQYDQTYQEVKEKQRPESVVHSSSQAPVFAITRGFLSAFDLTMQLRVGCPGGCLFCYVSSAPRLAPADLRKNWGFELRPKVDMLGKVRRGLKKGDLADRVIYWSGVTDPYAVRRSETRAVWDALLDTAPDLRPRRIVIQTRFRPDRDRFLIRRYIEASSPTRSTGPPVVVSYSIGTDRNDLIHAWERATPTYEQRVDALEKLRAQDIPVVPTLSPFSIWNDLEYSMAQFRRLGVEYLTVLFFKAGTRWANTPRTFLSYLRRRYPELLDPRWQEEQLERIHSVFEPDRVFVGKEGFASLAHPPRLR